MTEPHPNWPSHRIASDRRALGLAFAGALRPGWDAELTARRITGVVGAPAIRVALAKVQRTLHARPSEAGRRAEAALRLALELVEGPFETAHAS